MKHTPGPWEIGKLNRGPVAGSIPVHTQGYMETFRNGQLVCSVYGTAGQSEANALLIAACPDLLEALKEAVLQIEYLHEKFKPTGSGEAVLAKAKAAIIKALGEE